MDAYELKPCPFCGGKAVMRKDYDPDAIGAFYSYVCSSCGARSSERYARETCPIFFEEVRELWNARSIPTPSPIAAALALPEIKTLVEAAMVSSDVADERRASFGLNMATLENCMETLTVIEKHLRAALASIKDAGHGQG